MRARILIVGGGVVGTSVAMYAARDRDPLEEPVVLLEKSDLAGGASGRSGGVVHQQDDRREVAGMARDSLRFYETFRSRTGRSCGFRRSGVLTIATGARGEAVEKNAEMLSSIGIDVQVIRADEIRERVPGLCVDPGTVGVFETGGGYIEPERTIQSFAALGRFYGAATRLGVEVHDLHIESGRVVGASTSEGDYETDQLVLSAGPWLQRIVERAGIDLPLRSVRTEHHYLATPATGDASGDGDDSITREVSWTLEESGVRAIPTDEELEARFGNDPTKQPHIPHPVVFDLDQQICVRPDPESGRVRIGRLGFEEADVLTDPDDLAEEVSLESRQALRASAERLFPHFADYPDLSSHATWCTLTTDGRGLAGAIPGVEGLFVTSGFTNHDFHLAPSIGEGLAQMLRSEPVSAFDPEYFTPGRFATT